MERIDLWDEDDEEERYFDVPDPQPSAVKNSTAKAKQLTDEVEQKPDQSELSKSSGKGGWVHRDNIVLRAQSSHYDRSVRNPLFAHAETSIASELLELRKHYHPTVAIFAANLLDRGNVLHCE
ncbi:unnamed protein product [Anisakis simplex]|uniref:CBF domain-containing protein n=1 Tax=Anisakis simplex TaxID=6269 RepID=A0A0M3JE15_ANISI|nr:unnamed protein product [Anisakis simplex]